MKKKPREPITKQMIDMLSLSVDSLRRKGLVSLVNVETLHPDVRMLWAMDLHKS